MTAGSPSEARSSADKPARVRLDADDRRERLVEAAQRLFAERPYESISTGEIAAAAGTTRTNVHYHFRTKRDLFLEVIQRFSQIPTTLGHTTPAASVEDEARVVLGRWLDAVERNAEVFITMLHASSSHDPQVSGALTSSMQAWESRLADLVGVDPAVPRHSAMLRSFQSLVATATAEWLEAGTLTKTDVHALVTESLLSVQRAINQH